MFAGVFERKNGSGNRRKLGAPDRERPSGYLLSKQQTSRCGLFKKRFLFSPRAPSGSIFSRSFQLSRQPQGKTLVARVKVSFVEILLYNVFQLRNVIIEVLRFYPLNKTTMAAAWYGAIRSFVFGRIVLFF